MKNDKSLQVVVDRERVWIVKGNQYFQLAYRPGEDDDPAEIEWYAGLLRDVLIPQAKPEALYLALQKLENPYNEKDHGPGWQVAAHAWDMAIISAMRIVATLNSKD